MAIKVFTTKIGGRNFAFGNLALRRFTEALGCAPNIVSVHAAFKGSTQIGAVIEMIKGGAEQGNDDLLTDREAGDIMDTLSEEQQVKLMETFLSSIVGEPFQEYLDKLKAELEKIQQNEAAEVKPEEEPKNVEASPTGGAKSKTTPSEKSA
ncbi:hypothetical protein [Fibrella forsythiae]|uniref:Tail assembly chaperone n=1 Tax=Fibrella forsythiae TaxID=2817061 RepID=A0ABS3JDJ4_9BACT|nr:hypothetical protein [Fibrella forsythiae]MBO0947521.1 hypothetical protein [Fibrella forsythiae]